MENRSFVRFRLYAAISLAQCISMAESNSFLALKLEPICSEPLKLIITSECSWQTFYRLYENCNDLKELNIKIKEFLETSLE